MKNRFQYDHLSPLGGGPNNPVYVAGSIGPTPTGLALESTQQQVKAATESTAIGVGAPNDIASTDPNDVATLISFVKGQLSKIISIADGMGTAGDVKVTNPDVPASATSSLKGIVDILLVQILQPLLNLNIATGLITGGPVSNPGNNATVIQALKGLNAWLYGTASNASSKNPFYANNDQLMGIADLLGVTDGGTTIDVSSGAPLLSYFRGLLSMVNGQGTIDNGGGDFNPFWDLDESRPLLYQIKDLVINLDRSSKVFITEQPIGAAGSINLGANDLIIATTGTTANLMGLIGAEILLINHTENAPPITQQFITTNGSARIVTATIATTVYIATA